MPQGIMNMLDELLKRQDDLTRRMQGTKQYTDNNDSVWQDLSEMFDNDPALNELLESMPIDPAPPVKPFVPPTAPVITRKHIRALTKKHLYEMILDLYDENLRLKEENEKINRAFDAGYEQGQTAISSISSGRAG